MRKGALFFVILLFLSQTVHAFDASEVVERASGNGKEVKQFITRSEERGYGEWAVFLLSSMEDVDLVNLNSDEFISYFDALEKNFKRVPWSGKIDDFLFRHYILPHRVSQEPLENFTVVYADTLYDLIKDVEDMRKAVLRINEWTFTKMKYEPTSRWDQNATVTIQRGFGRCEEMAILAIKAMRAVCIPARKVYSPWWPFTNSNHAWVEVWVDEKWHSLGGGEPTDLENAWFFIPAKRAAIVKGVVYGEMEHGEEIIYKQEEGFTVINTTPNYTDITELSIQVKENDVPVESISVSICVYNYSSLPPVGLKKSDKSGFVTFIVGQTDLFVYASKDSLLGYKLWRPSSEVRDTIVIEITKKELPDTSFWLYTRRIDIKKKEPEYKPNRDSLKLLQSIHLSKINIADSSIASVLSERDEKLVKIFYNAKGGAKSLLAFYKGLSDILKAVFIDYFSSLHPKDVVSLDTTDLVDELISVLKSEKLADKSVPDSILKDYVVSDRILFEQIGKWRGNIQSEFINFRKLTVDETVDTVFSWVEKNVDKTEERGYFGPMQNPDDVYKTKRGTDSERYIFIAGILRSTGIPARVKWSYDAFEYWDTEWRERSFEEKKQEVKKTWIDFRFEENGKDITGKQRYYYDYSITRFEEYPKRLDPPVDTAKGRIIVSLDEKQAYTITGWRNGFGDTYVRIQRVVPQVDTAKVSVKTGIPEKVKPGDLIVRKYKDIDAEALGFQKHEFDRGEILIVVFDIESEASKSTLQNAKEVIHAFSGAVYLFADAEKTQQARDFLKEIGIQKGRLSVFPREIYKKQLNVRNTPSILYLKDGTCIFWVEGLFLHLSRLLHDLR